jgi:hypothetical protein
VELIQISTEEKSMWNGRGTEESDHLEVHRTARIKVMERKRQKISWNGTIDNYHFCKTI